MIYDDSDDIYDSDDSDESEDATVTIVIAMATRLFGSEIKKVWETYEKV